MLLNINDVFQLRYEYFFTPCLRTCYNNSYVLQFFPLLMISSVKLLCKLYLLKFFCYSVLFNYNIFYKIYIFCIVTNTYLTHCISNEELADMHMVYGEARGNAREAV